MKRVVVTGMGVVSSIGNNLSAVLQSLREAKSGIEHVSNYRELGFKSHVHGSINIDLETNINRKFRRFMSDGAAFCYLAMQEAIASTGLEEDMISHPRTGLIAGSGGSSLKSSLKAIDTMREKGARKIGPFMVPQIMSSSISANLAFAFKIKGVNYSISSACATSAHCIGNAYEIIKNGQQDIIFAGGGDEVHWTTTLLFDSMNALSSKYNDTPQIASRPFDAARDGFVISGGGGIMILEELEHALARKAKIYAELVGYGVTSDGFDMVKPSGEGSLRCMLLGLKDVDAPIDYVNAHATSTPAGDITELESIKKVFQDNIPAISASKSLAGHGLGAAGVNEAIYSLLMLEHDFISPSANIEQLDPKAEGLPIITTRKDQAGLKTVMTNSFGFGGTNATLVFQKP